MSIFKSTFSEHVKLQLDRRKEAMTNRTPKALSYLNSRNAWIRMSSSVNVVSGKGTNELAQKYILQGGTLNNISKDNIVGTLKSGIGDFSNAYSNTGQNGSRYNLGIRPMPGITSVEVKSLGAYGSLRQATVNFQCWDIHQLEDLELLYMRPGYTALVEWGWAPYLSNAGSFDQSYQPNFIDYYDIINKVPTSRTTLFRELYSHSIVHSGNYDAMFGYIKNYQWSARMDGGYDCQTIIISTGEILSSLKVNYLPAKTITTGSDDGLLKDEFINQGNSYNFWGSKYSKNILAGMWAETYYKLCNSFEGNIGGKRGSAPVTLSPGSIFENNYALINGWSILNIDNSNDDNDLSYGTIEVYITLEAALNALNKYAIAKSKLTDKSLSESTDEPLIKFSLYASDYDGTPPNTDLYCIAHPFQISVDPSVCLIRNDNWITVIKSVEETAEKSNIDSIVNNAYNIIASASINPGTNNQKLIEGIRLLNTPVIYNNFKTKLKENPLRNIIRKSYNTLETILNGELTGIGEGEEELKTAKEIKDILKNNLGIMMTINYSEKPKYKVPVNPSKINSYKKTIPNATYLDILSEYNKAKREDPSIDKTWITVEFTIVEEGAKEEISSIKINDDAVNKEDIGTTIYNIAQNSEEAIANLQQLSKLSKNYFYDDKPNSEIGILKNIYVNVKYLYQQALSEELENLDPNAKKEISVYNYVKKLMTDIQTSIGNINSFEIHVDPVDNNVARIIDLNYTEPNKAIYDTLYPLPIHSLDSTVRSYTLQSQIFPDQGAIIAIGAQAKGGQLGMQTNTLIDFNRNLTDRIIPEKVDAQGNDITPQANDQKYRITNGISQIITLFDALNGNITNATSGSSIDYNALASDSKNSLRDLIAYFQSITKSSGSNRNLIPTKFSAEMDGIGGLVIGHMFKLPDNILPKGYKGIEAGVQLGNVITTIGHAISNGDWVTKIDSLNIVLNQYANDSLEEFSVTKLNLILQEVVQQSAGIPKPQSTVSTKNIDKTRLAVAVQFFRSKGFSEVQIAALVGGFIQESNLDPKITNSIGAFGIAQWLGDRKDNLLKKSNYSDFQVQLNYVMEEFFSTEKAARNALRNAQTFDDAIVAAASYERFKGWYSGITYSDLTYTPEVGNRIGYSRDLYNRLLNKEF